MFQSAPRAFTQGDCDCSNRRGHNTLVHVFRQPRNIFRVLTPQIVKEQRELIVCAGLPAQRETPALGPSLIVRGRQVIGSTAPINSVVWPLRGVPSVSLPFRRENKSVTNLRPLCIQLRACLAAAPNPCPRPGIQTLTFALLRRSLHRPGLPGAAAAFRQL